MWMIDIPLQETMHRKVVQLIDEFGHVSILQRTAQRSEPLALEHSVGVHI